MTSDGSSLSITKRLHNLLRSPSARLAQQQQRRRRRSAGLTAQVTLEKVLGLTAVGNSGLACDPHSGLVAYPAGCVVVLLNPKKNRQQHLVNSSRKTITALAFSPDGKYLVTGESGHLPAVRVWEVSSGRPVAELQKHVHGVSCVAVSPDGSYVKDVVVAVNKVSSKVTAVSFSEDSSYFVTAGTRHLKFWYLEPCKPTKLRNSSFCDVACGRGSSAGSTFCVSSTGLLCEFNSRRTLDKWVDLRSLSLSDDVIFCGGADGTVRCFSPVDLRFLATLPRPHPLGTDVAAATCASRWLSCVYADHSVYVWDVRDPRRVGKVHSALYHAASVWDLQTFPDVSGGESNGVPSPSMFFSCSADSTIRQWCTEGLGGHQHNVLSSDLMSVIYTDESATNGNTTSTTAAAPLDTDGTAAAQAEKPGADGATGENRTGIRSICVSPDGKHLASGDRNGMLSRDRLIHVFDAADDYALLQTLDEHSSSITATEAGPEFRRSHHIVGKTTLYDMTDLQHQQREAEEALQRLCERRRQSAQEHSVTLETCRRAAGELHNSLQRTATLYSLPSLPWCYWRGGGAEPGSTALRRRETWETPDRSARPTHRRRPSGPGRGGCGAGSAAAWAWGSGRAAAGRSGPTQTAVWETRRRRRPAAVGGTGGTGRTGVGERGGLPGHGHKEDEEVVRSGDEEEEEEQEEEAPLSKEPRRRAGGRGERGENGGGEPGGRSSSPSSGGGGGEEGEGGGGGGGGGSGGAGALGHEGGGGAHERGALVLGLSQGSGGEWQVGGERDRVEASGGAGGVLARVLLVPLQLAAGTSPSGGGALRGGWDSLHSLAFLFLWGPAWRWEAPTGAPASGTLR
ncbi:LOW QUALITY PROTEIN: hypothetical protein CRUP_019729 [Coryphaenoides rupestris]|nr:LOW QUALITY PROTEIN: hypothetical protein CRUP_019729 [Coryphaenoides rupestris]